MRRFRLQGPPKADSREQTLETEVVSARTGFRSPADRLAGHATGRNTAVAALSATLIGLLAIASLGPALLTSGAQPSGSNSDATGAPLEDSSIEIASGAPTEESPDISSIGIATGAPTEESSIRLDPRWGDFDMFVGLGTTGGEAWGDRTWIGVNAPVGATCNVQLRFPTGVILDLGSHTVSSADAGRYRIWWTVPESAGRGWVQGKAFCVLGDKRAGGDWGYFSFEILGGTHRPEGWWIKLENDGFVAVNGTRAHVDAWVTGEMPSGWDVNTCSAVVHLPGGRDIAIELWLSIGVDASKRWFDVPADTPAGPGTFDVTCSSPNETKVVHGTFSVTRPNDPTPEPTPAPPTPAPTAAPPTPAPETPTPPTPPETAG